MKRPVDCEQSSSPERAADRRRAAARFMRGFAGSLLFRAAFVCAALLSSAPAAEPERPEPLNAALLTRDLGDPRQPANVKLVLSLPPALSRMTPRARADDFRVYVHPAGLSREEGLSDRYRADGLYLWRQRNRIFLDARTLPLQDEEGEAAVRVVFAPGGVPLAEGSAEGTLRYTSDLVDVVLAVDVSRSMHHNDPQKRRVAAARSFIEMARRGGGIGHVGLVTFNHRAALESPLIPLEEGETLIRALDRVGANGMTNLDTPLTIALNELSASRKPVVILLTDGKNEGSVYQNTHLRAAERGVRLFTVGLSEQADHALLREMADATGGIYFRAVKDSDLPEIYARLAAELGKRQMLRVETLRSADGEKTLPIDATVKRLVVLADGGARVGAGGGEGMFSTEMSGVLMGRPEPGDWTFTWNEATPDVSTLALFGDTPFFLDVFPPQLLGDRLAVGATLAEGNRPLAGGSVWVESIPGILASRMELFDDGRHRDGDAGDGVYAGSTVLADAPQRFDLTVRASGTAWDEGDFVRQAVGLAIKAPAAPPEAAVRLEGGVDFGVLFPGETGTADVRLELDAPSARDLDFDLSWNNAGPDWPDFASSLSVAPGRRALQLEMTIPPAALPGGYSGSLHVGDGDEIDESAQARVTVGTVEFVSPGALNLGAVPPGTFVSRDLALAYHADKPADLDILVDRAGNADIAGDIVATPGADRLGAGDGRLPLEIVVSAPMNRAEGDYAAVVRVAAGPGMAEIPVVWRVTQLAAAAPSLAPLAGLPPAPNLPSGARPLERTPGFSRDFWETGPLGGAEPVDSPWERAEQALRPRGAEDDAQKSGFIFPEVEAPSGGGGSFWSAWWLYILAALLLLLLLLLLLAYLLYRLGKSSLARFLLASALANIILLVVFILLLGAGTSVPAARAAPIAVNLIRDDSPVGVRLTPAEESLLDGTGGDSAAAGSSGGAMASGAALAQTMPAGGGQLVEEKQARLPEGEAPEAELSDAGQPSAMPLEQNETRPLSRDRSPDRNSRRSEMPSNQLAEMAEPPAAPSQTPADDRAAATATPSEARLEIEADAPSERPVWSTGDKPVESLAADTGILLADAAGMEKVSSDRTARRIDPAGRRRNPKDAPTAYPEPRVDIDDPLRDAVETAANDRNDANDARNDPGVEEVRIAARSMGAEYGGEKPGALLPPGAYRLADSEPERMARGRADNAGDPELSRPVGGSRSVRGVSGIDAESRPSLSSITPASSTANAADRTGGSNGTGAAAAEQRFDDAPSGPAGGSADGIAGASGSERSSRTAEGGGASGVSPNPFASGGGGAKRAEYVPAAGTGSGREGGAQRNGAIGRTGRSDSGSPQGAGAVPGGSGSSPSASSNDGAGAGDDASSQGRGRRSGSGEGRFDDMNAGGAGTDDGADPSARRSSAVPGGVGGAELSESGDAPGALSLMNDAGDWKRLDRRPRSRTLSVAASAVDADSLLIVLGDFARLPDSAAQNLFDQFARSIGPGLIVEERLLSPGDGTLPDTLLALATPEQIDGWTERDFGNVAAYLERGGHIWIDAKDRAASRAALERLAKAAGGASGALPETHPLADRESVDALDIDGRLAAIATGLGWRANWRFAVPAAAGAAGPDGGDGTMRFFIRALNYFLSGNADSGIVLEPGDPDGGTLVQPYREIIPDILSGGAPAPSERTTLWDDFGPETSTSWRMPSWSDAGRISAISDGQGSRALKLDLDAAVKGRAAAYRTLQPTQDFSGVSAVTLDAYYDGAGEASASMVFTVGEDGTWRDYESRRVPLRTGWNRLRFELDDDSFRSLAQGGAENGRLPAARARTGRAGFFVYRDGGSAAIVLFRGIEMVQR